MKEVKKMAVQDRLSRAFQWREIASEYKQLLALAVFIGAFALLLSGPMWPKVEYSYGALWDAATGSTLLIQLPFVWLFYALLVVFLSDLRPFYAKRFAKLGQIRIPHSALLKTMSGRGGLILRLFLIPVLGIIIWYENEVFRVWPAQQDLALLLVFATLLFGLAHFLSGYSLAAAIAITALPGLWVLGIFLIEGADRALAAHLSFDLLGLALTSNKRLVGWADKKLSWLAGK